MYIPECFSFVRQMIGCFCYPPHICCAETGLLHLPFPRGLQLYLYYGLASSTCTEFFHGNHHDTAVKTNIAASKITGCGSVVIPYCFSVDFLLVVFSSCLGKTSIFLLLIVRLCFLPTLKGIEENKDIRMGED